MSPFAKMLRAVLADEYVADWECGQFILRHKPSGISLWMDDGRTFFCVCLDAGEGTLSWWERWRLWPHAKRMQSLVMARRIVMAVAPDRESVR